MAYFLDFTAFKEEPEEMDMHPKSEAADEPQNPEVGRRFFAEQLATACRDGKRLLPDTVKAA